MSINPPNALAYIGEIAIPYINRDFDPLPTNNKFQVPTIWVNTLTSKAWILVSLALGIADWIPLTAGGTGLLNTLTIPGGTVITPTAGNITLHDGANITITGAGSDITVTATAGGIITLDGDTGSVTGAAVSLLGNTGNANCGATVNFTASTATELDLNVTDSLNNTIIGLNAGNAAMGTARDNIGLGDLALSSAVGAAGSEGSANVALGHITLQNLTTGTGNIATGWAALNSLTIGDENIAIGEAALSSLLTGVYNIAIGTSSGTSYTTNEESNIVLGNVGVVGESNTIRIGDIATQSACYIAGIATVATLNSEFVTVDTTTGQLGSTLVVPGAGISSVVRQVFIYTGAPQTYTPTIGMVYCDIETLAGGGAGGGAVATGASVSVGGGGGAGEYAKGIFNAAVIGISQVVTIGIGGAGAAGASGGAGGDTSVGALITAIGGAGGIHTPSVSIGAGPAGLGGTGGAGGDLRTPGFIGNTGYASITPSMMFSGIGANSQYGSGGQSQLSSGNGITGLGYGAGGSGAGNYNVNIVTRAGGDGSPGLVIITEYIA